MSILKKLIPAIIGLAVVSSSINADAKSLQKPVSKADRSCLVAAAWNEARGRPDMEIIAVMSVVINRTSYSEYPSTLCGVVLDDGQFQMTANFRKAVRVAKAGGNFRNKLGKLEPADANAITKLDGIAKIVLEGFVADPTHGATHFYSPKLRKSLGLPAKPSWANRMTLTASIGEFRFRKQRKS